jgi:hypothetical protein
MKPELAKHLDKVRETITEVERIISSHRYHGDKRTVLVSGLLSTIIQHHRSLLELMKSGTIGSAYALTRDIVRGLRHGLWINSCATEGIFRIEESDEFPLSSRKMG